MTREERIQKKERIEDEQRKEKEQFDRIWKNYQKLSYRDKLLFISVVQFMIDNPAKETANVQMAQA